MIMYDNVQTMFDILIFLGISLEREIFEESSRQCTSVF